MITCTHTYTGFTNSDGDETGFAALENARVLWLPGYIAGSRVPHAEWIARRDYTPIETLRTENDDPNAEIITWAQLVELLDAERASRRITRRQRDAVLSSLQATSAAAHAGVAALVDRPGDIRDAQYVADRMRAAHSWGQGRRSSAFHLLDAYIADPTAANWTTYVARAIELAAGVARSEMVAAAYELGANGDPEAAETLVADMSADERDAAGIPIGRDYNQVGTRGYWWGGVDDDELVGWARAHIPISDDTDICVTVTANGRVTVA